MGYNYECTIASTNDSRFSENADVPKGIWIWTIMKKTLQTNPDGDGDGGDDGAADNSCVIGDCEDLESSETCIILPWSRLTYLGMAQNQTCSLDCKKHGNLVPIWWSEAISPRSCWMCIPTWMIIHSTPVGHTWSYYVEEQQPAIRSINNREVDIHME